VKSVEETQPKVVPEPPNFSQSAATGTSNVKNYTSESILNETEHLSKIKF
jgi:hypothetical protein